MAIISQIGQGCGRGYDVVMLALHGFDAVGLEISATAVAEARKYAATEMSRPQEYNFGQARSETRDAGSATFVVGDFFESGWEKSEEVLNAAFGFDLVYDYTVRFFYFFLGFFSFLFTRAFAVLLPFSSPHFAWLTNSQFLCALHPHVRPHWAARMAQLVRPQGILICLEFPMYKNPLQDGPPWGVNGVHWDLLARGGDGMAGISQPPEAATDGLCGAFQRVHYFKPERSYESGKGTDMVSVYERK